MAVSLSGMTLHTNNDNEGGWGGTDGPDTYNNAIQGNNSESWLVAKNSTETGTLTLSSALNATRGIFTFWMSSNLAPYYTDINLELQSTTNNYKTFEVANSTNKAIGGDFVATAVDYVNKGTPTGTFAPASFSVTRIIVDNSSSGNIRSVINNWIDVMYYGPGHTISGTTTTDSLFAEAAAVDELTANRYGVLENYNDIIYSQGDLSLTGTALTSNGETLVFVDTINGYDRYNLDITGTVTFVNTALIGAGAIDFNLDTTGNTSFSMTGGSITNANQVTLIDGDTFNGVVLTDVTASSIANDPANCVWNTSGLITVTATGSLDKCTFNEPTGTSGISISSLDRLTNNTFNSDGTGHAVNLGTVSSSTTMNWNNTTSGYAATNGSTGNETILVSVASGQTLTINVASGATTPTYYNTGLGTVSVVENQSTITFNLNPAITGYEWRLYQDSATPGVIGTVELDGEETAVSSSQSYTYSGSGTDVVFQVIATGYEESLTYITLPAGSSSQTITLQTEENT